MLCDTCSGIRVRSDLMETNWAEKEWLISSLSEGSACELCRSLYGMLNRTPGYGAYKDGVAKGIVPRSQIDSASLEYLALSLEFVDKHDRRDPLYCSYTLQPVHSAAAGRDIECLDFNSDLAGKWLQHCDSNHECIHGNLPLTKNAGFHVIDIEDMCIVRAPLDCQYVALSYVWGIVNQVRLKKTNINRLEVKGSLKKKRIPQTIHDAFTICTSLGVRYLWVDRLCIVQNPMSHHNSQVAHMHQIYSGAYFTIIAATGTDASSGIFAPRPRKFVQHTARFGNAMYVAVPHHLKPLEQILSKSTWASRAWTMQEFVLSRRCLIFTGDECFLYCGQGAYVPGLSKRHLLEPPKTYGTSLLGHQLPYWKGEGIIHRRYARLASSYMSRELSRPKDILRAFEGITGALTPFLGKFRWGLPDSILRWALCWMHPKLMITRPGFPTWTWAGWARTSIESRDSKPSIENHDRTISREIMLSFPDHYADQFWPPCSVYYWTSNRTMKQIPSRIGPRESRRPSFNCDFGQPHRCSCDNARWIWNVQSLTGKRCSNRSYKRLLAIKSPAFKDVPNADFRQILTFASLFANLSEQPRKTAKKSQPLEPIPLLGPPSTFDDHIMNQELQGSSKLRQTYIFLGLLDHPARLFAVIVPVVVDLLAPGTNGNADQLVVRRCGNPCRLEANTWFERARRCIVHYR